MHPALRKGPLFTKQFSTFFTKKHPPPISFPAYGPVVDLLLTRSFVSTHPAILLVSAQVAVSHSPAFFTPAILCKMCSCAAVSCFRTVSVAARADVMQLRAIVHRPSAQLGLLGTQSRDVRHHQMTRLGVVTCKIKMLCKSFNRRRRPS